MILKNLLSQGNWIVYPRNIGKKIGVEETIILMQLIHASENFETKWFFQTAEKLEDLTGITYKRQKRCIEKLAELKLIETKLEGLPRKRYFRINEMAIQELLIGSSQYCPNGRTVSAETEEQGMPDGQSIYNKINKEESTEEDQEKKEGAVFGKSRTEKAKEMILEKNEDYDFTEKEYRHLKYLLRRLHEKEKKFREKKKMHPPSDNEVVQMLEQIIDNLPDWAQNSWDLGMIDNNFNKFVKHMKTGKKSKQSKAQFMQELYDDLQNREYDW